MCSAVFAQLSGCRTFSRAACLHNAVGKHAVQESPPDVWRQLEEAIEANTRA
jgi:hypothetical protein